MVWADYQRVKRVEQVYDLLFPLISTQAATGSGDGRSFFSGTGATYFRSGGRLGSDGPQHHRRRAVDGPSPQARAVAASRPSAPPSSRVGDQLAVGAPTMASSEPLHHNHRPSSTSFNLSAGEGGSEAAGAGLGGIPPRPAAPVRGPVQPRFSPELGDAARAGAMNAATPVVNSAVTDSTRDGPNSHRAAVPSASAIVPSRAGPLAPSSSNSPEVADDEPQGAGQADTRQAPPSAAELRALRLRRFG